MKNVAASRLKNLQWETFPQFISNTNELIGTINMPDSNHFTCAIKNLCAEIDGIPIQSWIYHDGMSNDANFDENQ